MPILLRDDKTFQKAHEEYKHFSADEALIDSIEAREKWQRDNITRMNSARKKGLSQDLLTKAREDAKK